MLFCQTGCCEACFILFRSCVSIPDFSHFCQNDYLKTIMSTVCLFLGCDFLKTDFIPTQISKSLWSIYILDFVRTFEHEMVSWRLPGQLYAATLHLFTSIALRLCSSKVHLHGPIYTTLQYLTLVGCIWHTEADYPPKFVDENNKCLNVMSEYFAHYKANTTTTTEENHSSLALVLRKKFNHCIRG